MPDGPMDMTSILDCALGRWAPGIGDPSVLGWVTVAAYAWAVRDIRGRDVVGPAARAPP